MKKRKYYQPTGDEFHNGFKYEIFEDFGQLPEKSWHHMIYGLHGYIQEVPHIDIRNNSDMDNIRVKCLDREDIEEVGGEYVLKPFKHEKIKSSKDDGLFFEYKYGSMKLIIRWLPESNIYRNLLISDHIDSEMPLCVFMGWIKNISELKKLLKQVTRNE